MDIRHELLTLEQAKADRSAPQVEGFAEAELADRAGFNVTLDLVEFEPGEAQGLWRIDVPPEVEQWLLAMAWTDDEGRLDYTLTRSTRHPGWQLTSWMPSGEPWGHHDFETVDDALDTGVLAGGKGLRGLAQVMFSDGTVMVRQGAQKIAVNPAAMARRNGDYEAFQAGEPVAYGPMVRAPKYRLAWALEDTDACAPGLTIRTEDGEEIGTDCDNVTSFATLRAEPEILEHVRASATPSLRKQLDEVRPGRANPAAPPVDASLWTMRPAYGSAGGPLVHALTDEGALKAFRIGSRLDDKAARALLELHARGGQGVTAKQVGVKVKLTELGKFDQTIWGRLRSKGYVERVEGIADSVRITDAGAQALRAGFEEQKRLLQRVQKAHPIETHENSSKREKLKRRLMR